MKIYVASSWRNTIQPAVVKKLRDEGHEVYDFHEPAPGNHGFSWRQVHSYPPPWSAEDTRKTLNHPVAEHGYNCDKDGMEWADGCVMVQPCGRSAFEEFGWFAGRGKLAVALLADGQEPELMLKLGTHICVSLDEVVGVLRDEACSGGRVIQVENMHELVEYPNKKDQWGEPLRKWVPRR